MRKLASVVSAVMFGLVVTALLAVADEEPLPKPNLLTEEAISTGQPLSSYDTIIIQDLKMDNARYEHADEDERAKIDAMKPMLNRIYQESLEMELRNRKLFKHIQTGVQAVGKAVVLEGEMVEFDAGSRAMRFWVGFGAGKTYLLMRGRLVDAQTGKELARFEDRETGYKGVMSMEGFEELFPHQAKSLGENVANFIGKLY